MTPSALYQGSALTQRIPIAYAIFYNRRPVSEDVSGTSTGIYKRQLAVTGLSVQFQTWRYSSADQSY